MKVAQSFAVLAASFAMESVTCFTTNYQSLTSISTTRTELSSSRRDFVEKIASVAFLGVATAVTNPSQAQAEVSQGNSLPDGVSQFKRLINLKSDIPVS